MGEIWFPGNEEDRREEEEWRFGQDLGSSSLIIEDLGANAFHPRSFLPSFNLAHHL